jgi:predicted 3-demethylubiquinone-9 3-methyltransferase (glyoxalase superfamily)
MQRITPFLWFDDQAEDAAEFYCSVFKNSKIKEKTYYTGEEPVGKKGQVMTVDFELDGQEFVALNGGPQFKFTEAISFVINCETQEEIDYYWDKLTSGGGEEVQCGWLADKYGLSWQVVPAKLTEWAKDAAGFQRVMHALMPMKKLDIATLQRAYDGK